MTKTVNLSKKFIEDKIGCYVSIATKESLKYKSYYEGILIKFEKDYLILDDDLAIDYRDVAEMYAVEIH